MQKIAEYELIRNMDTATLFPPELLELTSSSHTAEIRRLARNKFACLLKYQKDFLPLKYDETISFLVTYLSITEDSWQQRNICDLILQQMSPELDCRLVDIILREHISSFVRSHVFRQLSLVLSKAVSPCYREAAEKLRAFRGTQQSISLERGK
jgi:hypothetical protein